MTDRFSSTIYSIKKINLLKTLASPVFQPLWLNVGREAQVNVPAQRHRTSFGGCGSAQSDSGDDGSQSSRDIRVDMIEGDT